VKRILQSNIRYLALPIGLVLLGACESEDTANTASLDNTGTELTYLPEAVDPATAICDPFGRYADYAGRTYGLHGNLYYSSAATGEHYHNTSAYIQSGVRVAADLFFNQVNVPTRPWDRGFNMSNGQLVVNDLGEPLYEWFGVELNTEIQLSDVDGPGIYQFSVLSDDGAVVEIDSDRDGVYEMLVDNDGDHPTRMGCANQAITMDFTTRVPMRIRYYQGPRYHISLILLWKKLDDTGVESEIQAQMADPLCGQQGNSLFFDSTQSPPTPQSAFIALMDRDWNVLRPGNFLLPGNPEENPCEEICSVNDCGGVIGI